MFKFFLPKTQDFFHFFENHASLTVRAAKCLLAFGEENHTPENVLHQIKALELEGDKMTHGCVDALHKTFITPFDRTDIHVLISKMDDILDEIEDVARFIVLYKLKEFPERVRQLVRITIHCTQEVEIAVRKLRTMKATKAISEHFHKIKLYESEADLILIQGLGKLFEEEPDLRMIIKWKEVYQHLEDSIDTCEDVANILEGILLENE